jgi:hypothetical protein
MIIKDVTTCIPGKLYRVLGFYNSGTPPFYTNTVLNHMDSFQSGFVSGIVATIEPGEIVMFVGVKNYLLNKDARNGPTICIFPIVLYKGVIGFLGLHIDLETVDY